MTFLKTPSLSLVFLLLASFSAPAAGIAPHRAIYDIAFGAARAQSKINGGSGKWVMELTGSACTGFNVSYRFVTQLTYEDGRSVLIDTRGNNFEDGEGTAFDFSNSTYQNNSLIEDVKGIASRADKNVAVKLSRPETANIALPKDTLFPAQHFIKLIEDAKAGQKIVTSRVFEGVEGAREALDVTAVISNERPVESGKSLPYQALEDQKLRRWPVSLSYYKPDAAQDSTPEWQNSFLLYENGVSRDFIFDYGDFSLTGTLRSLEFLPEEDCS